MEIVLNFNNQRNDSVGVKEIHVLNKLNYLQTEKACDIEINQDTFNAIIKSVAAVREFFSGKKIVSDFEEIDFLVFQFNVINEIVEFLENLNQSFKQSFLLYDLFSPEKRS